MNKPLGAVLVAVCLAVAGTTPAASQTVTRVYTQFDSDKCRHTKGKDVEDYGSWLCAGHDGIAVRLSAGDQRMKVSFGKNAAREPAARETFPRFNSAYKGTIEWRIETPADGKPRAVRHHPALEREARGRRARHHWPRAGRDPARSRWGVPRRLRRCARQSRMPTSWRSSLPMKRRAVSSAAPTSRWSPAR